MSRSDRVTEGGETLLTMALKNANQTLNKRTSTQTEITEPLSPLATFEWDTLVIRKVGSGPLSKFLQNIRRAGIPQTGYAQLKNTILNGLRELVEGLSRRWWLWATCIRQFRLFETMTWGELSSMIRLLQLGHFDPPASWPVQPNQGWPPGPQLRNSTEANYYGNAPDASRLTATPAPRYRPTTNHQRPQRGGITQKQNH